MIVAVSAKKQFSPIFGVKPLTDFISAIFLFFWQKYEKVVRDFLAFEKSCKNPLFFGSGVNLYLLFDII
jgi:hypothetical protein